MPLHASRSPLRASSRTEAVRYEIRGELARRAAELEAQGRSIAKLNIGNPGLFGFAVSDHIRAAIEKNLGRSEAYFIRKASNPLALPS
jgi:alanine-synthesizing transaminase